MDRQVKMAVPFVEGGGFFFNIYFPVVRTRLESVGVNIGSEGFSLGRHCVEQRYTPT